MRQALKKAGGIVKKEDLNSWGDTYYSSSLLKDSSELFVSYTADDKGFALAQYTFPSSFDSSQVLRIRDMVASKYGSPARSSGNASLGNVSFTWNLKDGIELKVSRGWPDTTTYLTYKHIKNYAEQQAEMERQKRAAEAEQRASQSTNF